MPLRAHYEQRIVVAITAGRIAEASLFRLFAVDRSRLRVAKEVLALVAFTGDNYSETWFVSGLLETGFVLAWDLLFPFSMAMALISGIPISMVQSPG